MKCSFSFFVVFLVTRLLCLAQDTHYWTQQFGTRSALLGGATVGGARDNTAIYYNPGCLGFSDTGSISINGNLYRLESFRIENALGNKVDFKSKDLGSLPLLISGMFKTHSPHWRVGYGILQPIDFSFKAVGRLDGFYPVIDDQESPGDEELICQRNVSNSLRELMIVLGMAVRLNDHWSIGLSNLFTGRSQSYTNVTLARVFLNDTGHTLVAATDLQNFSYFHLRYSAKLGIAWQDRRWSAGLTLTTPGLRLAGKGVIGADYTGSNIELNGTRQDIVADGVQPKLKSNYKYPLSISVGLEWKPGRSMLALAGQYFGSEAVYDLLQASPAPFVRPAGAYPDLGADQFLRVKSAARAVWNVVIGYEQEVSSSITLQGSIRNDMSYYDKDLDHAPGIHPDITTWNIYTLSLGAGIRKGRSLLTLGLTGSLGSDDHHAEQGNYTQPGDDKFLRGATTITKATYSSFGILVGFKYTFRKI